MKSLKPVILLIVLILSLSGFNQSISGYVLDEANNPIPFSKVFVKDNVLNNTGAVADIEGKYSFAVPQGNYEIVYSSLGFESQTLNITVQGISDTRQNVYLTETYNELETVEIREKNKNVGYEIIKNVMSRKKELAQPFKSYTCELYIKGTESYDVKENKRKKEEEIDIDKEPDDVFQEEEDKIKAKIENAGGERLNLIEMGITTHFQFPNKIKEYKNASTKIGRPEQIYLSKLPVTEDCFFNFYDNLILKENLHETPIVSPLHVSGILSYKYKLKEIIQEGQDTIYRIHISPRSFGTSTIEGDLYVKKHDWALTKVDLQMHKGNLKIYDDFRVIQEYDLYDSIWLVSKQTFIYKTKYAKETVKGETVVNYSNYKINPTFPYKFFNNEVGITTEEAYERDSLFWKELRPEPLTVKEQRKKFIQDSLTAAYTKKEYLDSVDAVFNKIDFMKVAFFGIEHRNRETKTQWWLSSVVDLIEPIQLAGPRIGPGFGLFKKFKNEQWIDFNSDLTIGYLNKDLRGYGRFYHRYNPKKFATYNIYYSHDVSTIIDYAPILDYIDPSNYYMRDIIGTNHHIELINGLFFDTGINWEKRSSIGNLEFYNFWGEELETAPPINFESYFAFRTNISFSYTPGQKFLTEPKRKIIIGSKWPTFIVYHEKGWDKILGSSIDFDYLSLSINQEFNLGTIGKSRYRLTAGSFIRQDSIYYIDRKFFRQSDQGIYGWLMSDPLHSFQNLQSAYETREWYGQVHFIHHFNGALLNKIPFMKKTGLKAITGGGILFLPEYDNLYYQELFFGVERIFKLFRKRLRIGGYAIFSDSNYQTANLQFKLAFDMMDERDLKFNF
jgi:hypothetical protein